jgi:hypothetical protein
MQNWLVRQLPWILALALVVVALAVHVRTAFAAESAEQAVAAAIVADGARYAGNCADTVSPRDIGAVCSRLVEQRGSVRAYLVGRTFSEFSTWLFVVGDGERWQVLGQAPLRFHSDAIEIPWP